MHAAIAQHRSGISAICQRYRISRLEVFGSAARADDFDPATRDLERLLGRGVDLVEPGSVRNPFVLASINRNREAVYAA